MSIFFWRASRSGPSPIISHLKSSPRRASSAHASMRCSNPLNATSRPTLMTRAIRFIVAEASGGKWSRSIPL